MLNIRKFLLIVSYLVLFAISCIFSLKVFEAFFFNKYLIQTPNLKNMTYDEASIILYNSDLKIVKMGAEYSDLPEGQIYSQLPKAGKKIKKGRVLKVWISKGKNSVVVPDFRDMNLLDARVIAEQKGFKVQNITYVNHNLKYNRIITTEPSEGSIVSGNKEISFLVSLNKKEDIIRMPEIIGLTLSEAKAILRKNQLFIGNIQYMESYDLDSDIIIESSIERSEKVAAGSSVDVIVTK